MVEVVGLSALGALGAMCFFRTEGRAQKGIGLASLCCLLAGFGELWMGLQWLSSGVIGVWGLIFIGLFGVVFMVGMDRACRERVGRAGTAARE